MRENVLLESSAPVVTLVDERPSTSSLQIAACFGKQHKNVIMEPVLKPFPFGEIQSTSAIQNERGGLLSRQPGDPPGKEAGEQAGSHIY